MSWPPMLVHVKIENKDHSYGFWVPLFLIVLITLAILVALSPLILIGILVLWPSGWGRWIVRALKVVFITFCSMRGLKVDFRGRKETVHLSVI